MPQERGQAATALEVSAKQLAAAKRASAADSAATRGRVSRLLQALRGLCSALVQCLGAMEGAVGQLRCVAVKEAGLAVWWPMLAALGWRAYYSNSIRTMNAAQSWLHAELQLSSQQECLCVCMSWMQAP